MWKTRSPQTIHRLFSLSFFLFGTLNNIIYVVILSAALDLVDKAETPKVRIALFPYTLPFSSFFPFRFLLFSVPPFFLFPLLFLLTLSSPCPSSLPRTHPPN